jgi:glyoxylase-like metal-dependent hydrolase (beta-lactamase superfamily II)/8-oxo-dGTP pyrophosphatase MutT (NUDIX family)
VSHITEAASVLLARGPGSPEVFVVRRSEQLRFFGGFCAFPGGKVSPPDAKLLPAAPRRVSAARELFEETGVLLARRADGSFPPASADLQFLRRDLIAGSLSFGEILKQLGLTLHAEDLMPAGSLVTPPFAAFRFDTAFFVAELPPGQEAEVWPGELDAGEWVTADDLLRRWQRFECLVSPPTLSILEAIRGRPVAEAPARLAPLLTALDGGAIPPIFFAPGVQMIPLRTLALPPSTHTNAYLVGRDPAYLIDPGPIAADEQRRLFDLVDAHQAAGGRLIAVVLTHHHPDHIGAADACARRYGVPVWAHPLTARALHGTVRVEREIRDGDHLDLGAAPDGHRPWQLEALYTPGHASGHLAFWEPHYRLLFVADMISTLSSIVIVPPDGDLTIYLESLRRLRGYDARLLLPAHGSPSPRPHAVIDEALAHRQKREEQLLAALGPEPRRIPEIAPELYKGLPDYLMRFAELQVLSGLRKLQREGRVEALGEGPEQRWRLVEAGPL